jgi:DNA helicase Pif1, 2B domain
MLPLSELKLKVGCPVMVLRKLNPIEEVCNNGTRGYHTNDRLNIRSPIGKEQ